MKIGLLKREDGFTLPEMMVTITIMILVLFALYNIFDMSLKTFSFGNDKVEAVENARLGMEKMEREIRAAYPYNKGAVGTTAPDTHLFDTWTATEIEFGNDLNGDRQIRCRARECETVTYRVYRTAGGTYALGRADSSSGRLQPVVEYVDYVSATDTGLKFRYFRSDGSTEVVPGSGDESDIAMVRIELKIRVEGGDKDGTQTLTTDVALRNRAA